MAGLMCGVGARDGSETNATPPNKAEGVCVFFFAALPHSLPSRPAGALCSLFTLSLKPFARLALALFGDRHDRLHVSLAASPLGLAAAP